ncbi:MAG: hypothetical protein JWQ57_4556 [Mucilaginibacter sp.]|nr:hypothetical protein [Mucilaginibacter sp.]
MKNYPGGEGSITLYPTNFVPEFTLFMVTATSKAYRNSASK